MARLALKDELLDAQLLRAVGAALYGGADVGECLSTAGRVRGNDLDSWHARWHATAESVARLAERSAAAGHDETARLAYLRACTYYRTAGVMLYGLPLDPRLVASNAAPDGDVPLRGSTHGRTAGVVEIPFEDGALPGYFFRPSDDTPGQGHGHPDRWLRRHGRGARTSTTPPPRWHADTTCSRSTAPGRARRCFNAGSSSGPTGRTSSLPWWTTPSRGPRWIRLASR